jgi:uncharacterized protein (DUF1330 family)
VQEHEVEAIKAVAGGGDDPPVLMLNLNRYGREAGYPDGEDYRAYIASLEETIARVGAKVLWRTHVHGQPVGCEHDLIHEILAIWYPSHEAFLGIFKVEGTEEMMRRRQVCVEHAILHRCPGDAYPLQP